MKESQLGARIINDGTAEPEIITENINIQYILLNFDYNFTFLQLLQHICLMYIVYIHRFMFKFTLLKNGVFII